MHRVHLVILGRVQGVGFRWYAVREAERLGLAGTVANRADGGVEVEAEGDRAKLERLVEALRIGPRASRITSVDEAWSEGPGRFEGFHIGFEGS
jgi:acylphosphatase